MPRRRVQPKLRKKPAPPQKAAPPEQSINETAPKFKANGPTLPYVTAVLLMPLIVLWHNANALYQPLWYADPWFYLGYFRDLIEFKRDLFYGVYYGSRLAWILPGFLVHSLFRPVVANAVLHLSVQTVATLSLFTIIRLTCGIRSALLATLVFSTYPWLWVSTGWDYPAGAGIAYALLSTALLTRSAVHPTSKWSLIGAGAAIAGMVYTHLFLGTLAPLLGLYFVWLLRSWHRIPISHSILALCLWAGLGFAAVTLLFCSINYLLDGSLWFYRPSLALAFQMAKDFRYVKPIWEQGQLVPWLWLDVAGCITAIVVLATRWKGRSTSEGVSVACSVMLLLATSYLIYMQLRGSTVLGHYPYASYLLPFVFLAMGSSFWPAVGRMGSRSYRIISAIAVLIFVAIWYNPYGGLIPASPGMQIAVVIAGAMALAAALVLRERMPGTLFAIAGFAAFTAVALAQTVNLGGLDLHGTREQYERVMRLRDHIEAVRHGRDVRFWFDQRESNFHEYVGLNALYIEEFSQISTSFPSGCEAPVDPNTLVVVTSQNERAAELADMALANCWRPFGMHPVVEAVEKVARPDRPYILAMLRADATVSQPISTEGFDIPLEQVQLGDKHASLERTPDGLVVTTSPGFGAFAASVTLQAMRPGESNFALHIRVRTLKGRVSFGILTSDHQRFLLERVLKASPNLVDMVLPLPSAAAIGDFIISNRAMGDVTSKAFIDRIEVRKSREF